jgi:hypothetical protein
MPYANALVDQMARCDEAVLLDRIEFVNLLLLCGTFNRDDPATQMNWFVALDRLSQQSMDFMEAHKARHLECGLLPTMRSLDRSYLSPGSPSPHLTPGPLP